MTVCFEINRATAAVKGLWTLLEAARSLPDVPFVVVGRGGGDDTLARLQARAPANVSFAARFVADEELVELYRRARVYAQVSAHEAFGVAMAESMACGCVPVIADGHALGEIAGPVALRVPYGRRRDRGRDRRRHCAPTTSRATPRASESSRAIRSPGAPSDSPHCSSRSSRARGRRRSGLAREQPLVHRQRGPRAGAGA